MSEKQESLFDDATLNAPAEAGPQVPATGRRLSLADTGEGPLKALVNTNFLQYASYVIRDRAIPELDDGLKPVQRRILFSLFENDDGRFIKVANIVGYCMQFHPHGDASIGEALVTLANRGYLIEGQGNFGNVFTGDPAAAARYIECRLTDLAREELFNPHLTDFVPTYDGRKQEPVALPAKLPLLLMLGAEGIAVGLTTRVLPHNLRELLEAQIAILEKKPFKLLPDFPQGGLMDAREYEDGRGKVRVRARIERKDETTLAVRDLPFGVTTEQLIASIEDAARKGKIKLKAIRDFTAEKVDIEIQLGAEQDADKALQALYAFTCCEVTLNSRVVVICKQRPVEMTVSEALEHQTRRLANLLKRELQWEQRQLIEKRHAMTLVRLFVENRIYRDIEKSESSAAAQQTILDKLLPFRPQLQRDITRDDLDMLMDLPIKRIARFDIERSRADEERIVADLQKIEKHLAALVPYAIHYLKQLLRKHGEAHPRHTKVQSFAEIELRELTARELSIAYDREKGYLGSEVEGEPLLHCSSYDKLLLVWENGLYKVLPPPDKLFVDKNLIYAGVYDRDRVMTVVYRVDPITFMKRMAFGGAIMNKEYTCVEEGGRIVLLAADDPEAIYVKYEPRPGLKIKQQVFHPRKLPVKAPKNRGIQMTAKPIKTIATTPPKQWDKEQGTPRGAFMDFV